MITRLIVEGYKPYEDRFELDLRRLNVFMGKNGSGKSAILRAVPLLLYSLSKPGEPGLPLSNRNLSWGEHFVDLVSGKASHGKLSLGMVLDHDGEKLSVNVRVQSLSGMDHGSEAQVIDALSFDLDGKNLLEVEWLPKASRNNNQQIYQVKSTLESKAEVALEFDGVLPKNIPVPVELMYWLKLIQAYYDTHIHVGPVRRVSKANMFTRVMSKNAKIGFYGEMAAEILERDSDGVYERVKSWYSQEEVGGRNLELAQLGSLFQVLVSKNDTRIGLTDVGEGLNQVLPIVVDRLSTKSEDCFQIYEEPESHLHPAAHSVVAELFVPNSENVIVQSFVETHSEVLLLRLRRAVAEKRLDPSEVALFFVEDSDSDYSELISMEIDPQGLVQNWPEDIFSEDYREVLAIGKAVSENGTAR